MKATVVKKSSELVITVPRTGDNKPDVVLQAMINKRGQISMQPHTNPGMQSGFFFQHSDLELAETVVFAMTKAIQAAKKEVF